MAYILTSTHSAWYPNGSHHARQKETVSNAVNPGTIVDCELFFIQLHTIVNLSSVWGAMHDDNCSDPMEGTMFVDND